jgi:hypothetical protein
MQNGIEGQERIDQSSLPQGRSDGDGGVPAADCAALDMRVNDLVVPTGRIGLKGLHLESPRADLSA